MLNGYHDRELSDKPSVNTFLTSDLCLCQQISDRQSRQEVDSESGSTAAEPPYNRIKEGLPNQSGNELTI